MSEKELTPEELEAASGGRRTKRANKPKEGGTVSPTEESEPTGPTPTFGDGTPLGEPPFKA